jgi:hypothetical protein
MFTLAASGLLLALAPANSSVNSGITGQYVEARTCDVWTGPCFANADFNLAGKNAVMAWKIERGTFGGVSLDGLGVVAVISAGNTLGLEQNGPARTVFIVDRQASAAQRDALVRMAQAQGGQLLKNVVAVQNADVSLTICECKENSCAEVSAGGALIKTRCLNTTHDKACGNESAFYPPLTQGVAVRPAAAVEHTYNGTGLQETWRDFDRRGAYVGTFAIR